MAAEITPITESNQDEILRILREIEAVLIRFRPLLEQAAVSPLATRRALRKAGRDAVP